jgi:hypothetical protein
LVQALRPDLPPAPAIAVQVQGAQASGFQQFVQAPTSSEHSLFDGYRRPSAKLRQSQRLQATPCATPTTMP